MTAAHLKPGEPHPRSAAKGGRRLGTPGTSSMTNSFAGHYGQLIVTDGIAPIPRALYLYQAALNLSPQQVWFISCVLAHKWNDVLPHPRLQELARHATLSLRQIKNIKNSLLQAGLLKVEPRYGTDGEQDANSYDFGMLFDKIEALIVNFRSDTGDTGASNGRELPEDELAEDPPQEGQGEGQPRKSVSQAGPARPVQGTVLGNEGGEREVRDSWDYSFAARYGRVVLRRGVAAIPRALFTYQAELGLSPQQMWFIGYILSFQWSTDLPYPSLRKMAQNTGYSERHVRRIKDDLVHTGHLRLIERHDADGRDTTSAYDFGPLLQQLNSLIRRDNSECPIERGTESAERPGSFPTGETIGRGDTEHSSPQSAVLQPSLLMPLVPPALSLRMPPETLPVAPEGGETDVSRGVQSPSEGHEAGVRVGVNCMSEGGVKPVSGWGVNCMSYRIESVKEEEDKEEHQQQPSAKIDNNDHNEDRENAYYALVDVGVIPAVASDLATRFPPDHIREWVRYHLSVLSHQKSLDNPVGVLVKRLRSGEEPPYVPSQGDLQSLRLQMSRYTR